MSLLVRKIEKRKWKPREQLKVADIPADAITGCLRTQTNTLSVWEISQNKEDKIINEGILALVTGPQQMHIESIDIVLLNPEELESKELEIVQKEGQTQVEDLAQAHRNISNLTYAKLGMIAEIILKNIHNNNVKRRTRLQITKIIIEALKHDRLKFNSLHENIRETIIESCEVLGENIECFVK